MSKEHIAAMRAELEPLRGPARMPGLVRLGQALLGEYAKEGPGTPGAKPDLDASIQALDEAYGYMQADDAMRGTVAGLLGYVLAARFLAHGGPEHDCQTGIHVSQEALSFPNLTKAQRAMSELALGQLCLGRAVTFLQSQGFSAMALGGYSVPAEPMADADRAVECFRAIADGEPIGDEVTMAARTMLDVAETLREVFAAVGGGLAGLDIGRFSGALAQLQRLQEKMKQGGAAGYRMASVGFMSDILAMDPLDRPVAVMQGMPATADFAADPAPTIDAQVPAAAPDAAELRKALYALLPKGNSVWLAATELLLPGAVTPHAATVDEMVALASTIVEQPPGEDRAQEAIDAYLLAIGLLLRDRLDQAGDGADRQAALEELLLAAQVIPLDHPAAIVVLRSLGAFLDESRPLDGVDGVAAGFADRIDSAIAAGIPEPADLVALHALRCVCRAAEAMADLRRAAGTVPAIYPWLASIAAAGRVAASAVGSLATTTPR